MMNKSKIAISINAELLQKLDKLVDNQTILSRSHAIESLLEDSLKKKPVDTAVLIIKKEDVKYLFEKVYESLSLLDLHVDLFVKNGIETLYVITQADALLQERLDVIKGLKIALIDEPRAQGTAAALKLVEGKTNSSFVFINGDTFNDFNLKNMIRDHISCGKSATMGLMSSSIPSTYGSVILDGNLIVEFNEKKETDSHVVNAGVYIFSNDIFNYLEKGVKSLERDLFPKLAKFGQLQGFFTCGKYHHLGD